jgi:CTD small phosphatase-like protein 2
MYRHHCVQTPEGYYVKDLRIIRNRDLKDMVIVDNSVYSFAYQIDNGIPIIPFYHEQTDEEMLHLIFYLDCLNTCEDVRAQNREAFELHKLSDQQAIEQPADFGSIDYEESKTHMKKQNSVVEERPTEEDEDEYFK